MTALGTVSKPTLTPMGAGAGTVAWTQVADADTYEIKVYPKAPKTSVDYDLADDDLAVTVTRTPGTGATTELINLPSEENSNPTGSFKVSIIAKDSTATKTDSTESTHSDAATLKVIEEAQETEAPAEVETINPFTGKDFAFAGATYGTVTYGRNDDGTVYQSLAGGDSTPGTPGPRAGTQSTRQRDTGDVTAALSLASDLRYVLTDPTDPSGGVAVVDPVAHTVSTPANTYEDYFVVGEGSYTDFSDRVGAEVGAPDVQEP